MHSVKLVEGSKSGSYAIMDAPSGASRSGESLKAWIMIALAIVLSVVAIAIGATALQKAKDANNGSTSLSSDLATATAATNSLINSLRNSEALGRIRTGVLAHPACRVANLTVIQGCVLGLDTASQLLSFPGTSEQLNNAINSGTWNVKVNGSSVNVHVGGQNAVRNCFLRSFSFLALFP